MNLDTDISPESTSTQAPEVSSRTRLVNAVLAVTLIASLVALGLVWRSLEHHRDLEAAGTEAERAARLVGVQMTSYDYRSLDADFAWVDKAGTSKFSTSFKDVSKPVQDYVKELKAHAEGKVIDSAADVTDASHVKVVLFIDQTISSDGTEGSKVDQPRVTMSMVKRGDTWLIDKIDLNSKVAESTE